MVDLPVIEELTVSAFLTELGADSLFPSAGAAAALTGAQAAALFAMVCRVNLRKLEEKEAGAVKENPSGAGVDFWQDLVQQADACTQHCLELAQEDGEAYEEVVDGNPQGPAHATEVPLEIARRAIETARLIDLAIPESYAPVRADAETARCLAQGSKKAALTVARYNLPLLKEKSEQAYYVNQIGMLEQR